MSFLFGGYGKKQQTPNTALLDSAPLASNILGTPWPDLYGQRELAGTLLAWTDHQVVEITEDFGGKGFGGGGGSVVTGYQHYRTIDLGLCLGPCDILRRIYCDASVLWEGFLTPASAALVTTADVGAGGTVISTERGTIAFYFGLDFQEQDPYLKTFIPQTPYLRGFTRAVLRKFYCGTSDNLPPLAFVLQRVPPAPPGTVFYSVVSRTDQQTGIAADFALTADLSAFIGLQNRRYRLSIQPVAGDNSKAVISYGDFLQIDSPVSNLQISNSIPFALGTFGATATMTWTGALGTPGTTYAFDVWVQGYGQYDTAASPIYVAYERLTSNVRGVKLADAFLNTSAFIAVAPYVSETCLADASREKKSVRDELEGILGDTDAGLACVEGRYKPFLLRSAGASMTIQQDDLISGEPAPSSWWETATQATVKFRDGYRRDRDGILPLSAAGSNLRDDHPIDIQLDRVNSLRVATVIGTRKFALARSCLTRGTIVCQRTPFALDAGDVVEINAPLAKFTAGVAWRILKAREIGSDDRLEFDIIRDIFGNLPTDSTDLNRPSQPDEDDPTPPSPDLPPVSLQEAFELPWDLSHDQQNRFTLFAERPSKDAEGMTLYISYDGTDYYVVNPTAQYHAGGLLKAWSVPRFTLDRLAWLQIRTVSQDLGSFMPLSDTNWLGFRMIVIIGTGTSAAVYLAKEIFLESLNTWRLTGLMGPWSDTDAASFGINKSVFVFPLAPRYAQLVPYSHNGQTIYFKAIPYGQRYSPGLGSAIAAEVNVTDRSQRPFPCDNLVANGAGDQSAPSYSSDIAFAWDLRNRGFGLGYDTNPSPLDPTIQSEIDLCDVEIWVAGTLKRTASVTVQHGTTSTTITGTPTNQVVDVASPTGLQAGYRVSIVSAGIEWFGRIASISGSTVILVSPLPVTPIAGDAVNCYESVGFVYTAAMNTADNGSLVAAVVAKVYPVTNGLRALRAAQLEVTLTS